MIWFLSVGSFVVVVAKLLGFCCGSLDVVEILGVEFWCGRVFGDGIGSRCCGKAFGF